MRDRSQELQCPDCRTDYFVAEVHVCPVTCRARIGPLGPEVARCPCCRKSFQTRRGHLCDELVRVLEPMQ